MAGGVHNVKPRPGSLCGSVATCSFDCRDRVIHMTSRLHKACMQVERNPAESLPRFTQRKQPKQDSKQIQNIFSKKQIKLSDLASVEKAVNMNSRKDSLWWKYVGKSITTPQRRPEWNKHFLPKPIGRGTSRANLNARDHIFLIHVSHTRGPRRRSYGFVALGRRIKCN